jgi:hypothetical protein
MPAARCPVCEQSNDAATSVSHYGRPAPGDITVCLNCGCVLTYTGELQLRRMTREQIEALPKDNFADVSRVQTAILVMLAQKKRT